MILRLWEDVSLLLKRCRVGFAPPRIIVHLRILPQIVEKCSLLISWLVHRFETARIVRYVRISATSIVCIVNWFWVNHGQWLGRPLLCCHERTWGIDKSINFQKCHNKRSINVLVEPKKRLRNVWYVITYQLYRFLLAISQGRSHHWCWRCMCLCQFRHLHRTDSCWGSFATFLARSFYFTYAE